MDNTIKINAEKVNPGYQDPKRAISYNATQAYIVDKTPLLELAKEKISGEPRSRIVEFGIGPGNLIDYFANAGMLREGKMEYVGVDLSEDMVEFTKNLIEKHRKAGNIGKDITFTLISGANAINPQDSGYDSLQNGTFDVAINSQFEHYFPNSRQSELAKKLTEPYLTKRQFRQKGSELLREGGVYITIDDRLAEEGKDSDAQRKLDSSWDEYVARNFTNKDVLNEIAQKDAGVAEMLRSYESMKFEKAVEKIRRTRVKRREVCNEELESLSQTLSDLQEVFGNNNHEMHPALNNFYIAWAHKNGKN